MLFPMYIDDLVDDINQFNCGIGVDDTHMFLYDYDIVVLSDSAEDMQRMLILMHLIL